MVRIASHGFFIITWKNDILANMFNEQKAFQKKLQNSFSIERLDKKEEEQSKDRNFFNIDFSYEGL